MAAAEESIVTCTLDEDVDVLNDDFALPEEFVVKAEPTEPSTPSAERESDPFKDDEDTSAIRPLTFTPVAPEKKSSEAQSFKYRNAGGNFFTGIDTQSEEACKRRAERAKRFGVEVTSSSSEQEEELVRRQARAARFGTQLLAVEGEPVKLVSELPQIPEGEVRSEAVHLHGTDEMSTADIFAYFRVYAPRNVEWINDSSCNVVWDDSDSAHRALKGLGRQPVAVKERFMDDKETVTMTEEDKEDSTPAPTHQWRLGEPHAKAKQLLLRYAISGDKKVRGAAQFSEYYYKYGNPNAVHHKQSTAKKKDLRDRLDRKRSPELMDVELEDSVQDETSSSLFSFTKRPRTLHSDREEGVMEVEGGRAADLRAALMKKKKKKELKMRLGARVVTETTS